MSRPDPPLRLGAFLLARPLARGGMGQVWEARVARGGEPAAIKVLPQHATADPGSVAAILDEIRTTAALDHPHVIRVWDAGLVDPAVADASAGQLVAGSPWLAMELAAGGTLADRAERDPLGSAHLFGVLEALLLALGHAHARGVIHRDLKPANVLFARDDGSPSSVRLTDFGVAHALEREVDGAEPRTVGTPRFMAPEQFTSTASDHGPWTDLYALGCLAWWMTTGATPHEGRSIADLARSHSAGALPPFSPQLAVPSGLERWIRTLLSPAASQRYQRAADALRDLRAALAVAAPTGPAVRRERAARRPDNATLTLRLGELTTLPAEPHLGGGPPVVVEVPERWEERPDVGGRTDPREAGLGIYTLRVPRFLGRTAERTALWDELGRAWRDQQTRAVVVRGPAGMGKSRLIGWLGEHAHELGVAETFRATHQPTSGPWDGLRGMAARVYRVLGLPGGEAARRAGRLPGLQVLFATPEALDAHARHQVAAQLVVRRAGPRLGLVWIDDAHWGLDALRWTLEVLEGNTLGPALVLLAVRDEALADRPDEADLITRIATRPEATTLELGPLGPEVQQRLLQELLVLDPWLADRIGARAGGNPLYAVQLVGSLLRRGELRPSPHGFRAPDGASLALEPDLASVWRGRVAALVADRPEWDLPLQVAAVLGLEVDRPTWHAACAALGTAAPAALVLELLTERLVRFGSDAHGDRFVFVHGMLRDAILARARDSGDPLDGPTGATAVLPRLHRAAAAAVGTATVDARGRAGLHLLAAGDVRGAADHLRPAASAMRNADPDQAALWLYALDDALSADPTPSPERVGEWVVLAWIERARGRGAKATQLASEALARSAGLPDLQHRALGALFALALDAADRGRARELALEGARLAEQLDDPQARIQAFERLGEMEMGDGRLREAEQWMRRALAVRSTESSPRTRSLLARVLVLLGRYAEARELVEAVRAQQLANGWTMRVADSDITLGEIARGLGDLRAAEVHHTSALEGYRAIGSPAAAVALVNLGLLALGRGDPHAARIHLEEAMVASVHQPPIHLCARAILVRCVAGLADWAAFDLHLEAVRAHGDQALVEPDVAAALEAAGDLAAARGHPERARAAWIAAGRVFAALSDQQAVSRLERRLAGGSHPG